MFDKSANFPEGWFFIKNSSNGYVLMVENESHETGSPIVLSTLRTKGYDSQLWRHDIEKGYLVNKKSGQVMDVHKGNAKAGVDIIQQIKSATATPAATNCQSFGLSPQGHIYLTNKSSLVLGIKESFFARREGLHVHLQLVDKKHLDRKEQRWDFVLPVVKAESVKRSIVSSSSNVNIPTPQVPAVAQIKEDDTRSVRSTNESICSNPDQDESAVRSGSFPETAFFLKSDAVGLYISLESPKSISPDCQLTLEAIRKRAYDSQLWIYDATTQRVTNKFSGLVLGIEGNAIKDGADLCQVISSPANDKTQAWFLSPENELTLKSDPSYVMGYKESWFGSREGAHLHLQKRTKGTNQKFSVVLPVFKKSETVKSETKTIFPTGWFFIKSQAHGLVLSVLETGVIAAEVAATTLDTSNYSRQLWKFDNGFIINKTSNMVLDVRGGEIKSGAGICQFTQKTTDAENQKWALTNDGAIYPTTNKNLILCVNENETIRSALYLTDKKASLSKAQRWNFVLPVFKKKQVSTVKKITTFRYAAYPSGWFFIRTMIAKSTTESPYVLTASDKSNSIDVCLLDRNEWQNQLWSFSSGKLINYGTDHSIDVSSTEYGAYLLQSTKSSQKWHMTTDGYLFYGSVESNMAVSVVADGENKYKLALAAHKHSQEFRWGFLIPKFSYRSGIQILSYWSIVTLKEYRKLITTTTQTTVSVAQWPEGEFYIRGQDGYALVPEKNESGASLTMRKLDAENHAAFKWTFKNYYLVHCATGLVMHVQDTLSEGAQLQLAAEQANNENQHWLLRIDGSIISKKDQSCGLNLVQVNGFWTVRITTTVYYAWRFLYGRYSYRYSEKEKREISYLVSFQRIVLSYWISRKNDTNCKLVKHSYGIFPKGWLFIRSKCDPNLFVTLSGSKKGAKLILSKLDFANYKRQLWRYRDDGCIVNFDTDYVIDVAGGKLLSGSDIIQWNAKFLRSSRKNQMWSLSVDGHIHPQSNTDLVLSSLGDHAIEGAELKLVKRGDNTQDYQQWSFASPVFKKCAHVTYSSQQANKSSLELEKIGESHTITSTIRERYETITKRTIIRRWAHFPDGKFFIRSVHGDKTLALTVERDEATLKYRVVIRSLSFNAYKWQLWCYRNGHIVNEETGLVLDAQRSQDDVIEGEQTQVYLKEGSVNEGQYWNLGVNGEIYLRSNEKLLLGPNRSAETTTEGSLVGINKCRMVRTNIDGKESYVVKSEEWLRWSICKPVFGQDNVTIERTEEHVLAITKTEEVVNDDEEDIFDEDIDEDDTNELEVQTPSSSTSVSTLGTRGVSVVTSGTVTTTEEKPAVQPKASTSNSSVKSSSSSKSRRSQHSFQLEDSYIPTGFEKIARYKTHHNGFPSGYFFIKSCLHGYVLDITGAVNEDSDVVLTRLKSTDFASQLWTYQKGFLVNLKGQSLVLDAARSNVKSGERAHLSQRSAPTENADDQVWEYSPEGHVHLKAKRSLVLSLKETRRSDKHDEIQVYVQEAKPLVKKEARLEQRWELLVPALIPLEQGPGGVKIIESGKVERTITTTVVTYSWLKELLRYRVSRENQWPTAQGWFYIRFGAENRYLASGETAESEVGLYEFDKSIDYKRYLWAYVDGYLINYRYLLRLVLTNTRTWTLSDSHSTLDQKFVISTNGLISVSVKKVIYYICYIRTSTSVYKLSATTDKSSKESQGLELQIPVISDEEYNKKCVKSYKDVHSWVRRQLTEKYTLTKTIRVGRFPASTWFFIKVDRDGKDDLVLASTSDSQLVLKKIDFKNFQSQLWTHKNGLLINYGSKLVIDIKDSIKSTSTVITSKEKESAIGQKWIITVDGLIQHEGNDKLVIGTESLKEGTSVLLTTTDKSHSVKYIIRWKFGIPSFGQYTITRKSTLKDVTKVIEDGAVIQGTKDITAVKKTANDLVRKEIKSYYTVIIETRLITRWWKTIFIHRLTSCRTQKEYLQVIEEYRRVLYTRLNQYFITYGSNLTEEQRVRFEKSVKDIKDIIEKEVFEKSTTYLKTLKSDDTVTVDKFDIAKITHISCELVEKKYKSILDAEKTTEKQVITKETFTKRTIVTTKTIQYIIRYWITTIQRRIIEQKKAGASKETIAKYMIEWKKELDEDLSKVEKSYDTTIIESTTVDEKTKDVSKKAFLAILEKSKSEIESTISLIDYASEEIVSETYWNRIVRQLVKRVCQHVDSQTTVTDESSESESEEESIDKDTFEFSQNETVTTLIETKQYISVWYKNLLKDITSTLEDKNADIKDVTVYIDTAEVDITSKIDEINEKIAILSHNLVNLNWKQRRYVISYINRLKINIIGSLTTFRTTVKEKDKKSLLDYSQVVFSEEVVQDICSETESVIDVINTTAKHTTTTTTYLTKDVSKHTDTIVSEDQNIVKRDTVEDKKQKAMDKTTVETVKDKKHTDEVTTVIAEKVTVVGTVEEKKPNNETTVVNEEVTTVTREVTEEKPKHEVTEVTVVETVKDKNQLMKLPLLLKRLPL
ncbi:hypothetical protein BDB01DRAFT_508938 [Pilobolus umbonatus]|nr:hypothetical protein BDB01DRAFT_508938 [Pilobolus umbonatus]